MNSVARRAAFLIALLLLGVYAYVKLRGPQGLPALLAKQAEIRHLEEENANLARENEYKRERIKKLQESRSEQDLEIRRKLKMLKPGDQEFILPGTRSGSK